MSEQRKRGRTPGQCEPTKKKDFRFPVRLLDALKAAADEDGMSDSEWLFALLKGDTRIQKQLFEDSPIQVGDQVLVTRVAWQGKFQPGIVRRIDRQGVANKEDCYLVWLDASAEMDYFCGSEVRREVVMTEKVER